MSTELKATLQNDLTEAIRSRDELTAATVRMVLTSIKSAEVAGTEARTLDDDEIQKVLQREAKKRREAATAFADAGRVEMSERELAELGVLERYLPKQLSDDELTAIVDTAVSDAAAAGKSGMPAMGMVMKSVQAAVAGRADGGKVAAMVKARLAQS